MKCERVRKRLEIHLRKKRKKTAGIAVSRRKTWFLCVNEDSKNKKEWKV